MNWLNLRFAKSSLALFVSTGLMMSLSSFILSSSLLAQTIPKRWESNVYQPKKTIGSPGNLGQGGTRGQVNENTDFTKSVIPIVPENQFGVTVEAYPTFLVYVPPITDTSPTHYLEFVLIDENGYEVYVTRFQAMITERIISISLPASAGLSPLEVGKNYKWLFLKTSDNFAISDYLIAEGEIRRVELENLLIQQLDSALPQNRAKLYAQSEIWYDAIAILADLYRENPNEVRNDWEALLGSVGLDSLAKIPLIGSGSR